MSGDTTLRRPRTMEWQNTHYQTNVKLLSLANESVETRRKALSDMSAEELTNKLPAFQNWSPTIDGKFIPAEVTLGMLSDIKSPIGKPKWCEAIMVGDVEHDVSRHLEISQTQGLKKWQGTCLKGRIMDVPNIMDRLEKALKASLSHVEAERILEKYGLSGNLTAEQQYSGLLNLSTDLRFHFPVLKVAEGWQPSQCLRYHFHQVRLNCA